MYADLRARDVETIGRHYNALSWLKRFGVGCRFAVPNGCPSHISGTSLQLDRLLCWRKCRIWYRSLYISLRVPRSGCCVCAGARDDRFERTDRGRSNRLQLSDSLESGARHRCRSRGSGVGGHLHVIAPFTSGDISTKVNLYGAFRARFGYAFDRFVVLDNVMVYIALGGAFGSFSDKMAAETGPAFISYNQSTTRIQISKAVGSLGIGAAHPITPNISIFVDYRYTGLGPEWAHGRQINVSLPNDTAASFGTRAMYHLIRVGANWKFDLGM